MKIGYPNHPRGNIIEEITWAGENGFDFVDLFFEPDGLMPETADVSAIRSVLERYDLGVTGHTAWYLPSGSPLSGLRDAAVAEIARTLPVMKDLGTKLVTIHGNWAGEKLFPLKETLGFQADSLSRMVDEADRHGMSIMYEPLGDHRDGVENVAILLERVEGLKLHLDLGHAFLSTGDPCIFIEALHASIVHVHLSDNNGAEDLHLPMGVGRINWPETIKTLKKYYDGTITIEVFAPDKDYVLLTRKKLREMWDAA